MEIPNRSLFTPAALKRWDSLDPAMQGKLLMNVWCGKCQKAVHICVDSTALQGGDLILEGRCADCGQKVSRLIENE